MERRTRSCSSRRNKPRLDIQEEEIPFTTVTRENPQLPKDKQVVTKGANGHRTAFYSVSTSADGKEERTLVNSVVTQETVTKLLKSALPLRKLSKLHQLLPKQMKKQPPATGSQDSAALVAAGLMATLAAYGLTKRKEDQDSSKRMKSEIDPLFYFMISHQVRYVRRYHLLVWCSMQGWRFHQSPWVRRDVTSGSASRSGLKSTWLSQE